MMIISHNAAAFAAWRQVSRNSSKMSTHLERLNTGLRINRGADDAAGLSISEKLRSQIRGVQQAIRNAQDGISMIQTAEGALQESHAVLQRMRELLVQAANDTYTMEDRMKINDEIQNLKRNLDEIAHHTEFNTMKLLDGTASLRISSSSNLVELVAGENLSAMNAAASMLTQSSGALRVDMEISGGTSQVQNSHIYNQINGTLSEAVQKSPESGKYSGLTAFNATGLKEESYVIESREIPFGGVYYVDGFGNETTDPNAVMGISSMEVTATPNIVAFGDYDITPAKEVPFMAIFDDYQNTQNDLIRGVDPTGRDNIDVRMDVHQGLGATNAQTEVAWRDIGGVDSGGIEETTPPNHLFSADFTFQTDPNYNTNMYTHFQVEDLNPRQMLTQNIEATSSYVSANGSQMQMELTYKSQAGAQVNMGLDYRTTAASRAGMNLTYVTASASQVGVTATYYSKAGEQISFETKHLLSAHTITITIDGIDYHSNIGAGSTLEQAVAQLNTDIGGQGLNFTVSAGTVRHIRVQNNSGHAITIADTGTNEIGISHVDPLANGATRNGTDLDVTTTVNVGGRNIEQIRDALNTALSGTPLGDRGLTFGVQDNGNGTRNLTISNTGAFRTILSNDLALDSVETELGLNSYT